MFKKRIIFISLPIALMLSVILLFFTTNFYILTMYDHTMQTKMYSYHIKGLEFSLGANYYSKPEPTVYGKLMKEYDLFNPIHRYGNTYQEYPYRLFIFSKIRPNYKYGGGAANTAHHVANLLPQLSLDENERRAALIVIDDLFRKRDYIAVQDFLTELANQQIK